MSIMAATLGMDRGMRDIQAMVLTQDTGIRDMATLAQSRSRLGIGPTTRVAPAIT